MRISFVVVCIVTILFFFSRCEKKVVPTHLKIDSILLNNFNYAVGTYWVYEDSLTHELDSFSVVKSELTYIPFGKSTIKDGIEIQINQYNSAKSLVAKWEMGIGGGQILLLYYGKIYINYNAFVFIPIKVGILGDGYNLNDSAYVVSIKSIDTINSNNYFNVIKYRHFKKNGPIYDNILYYNITNGILKLDLDQEDSKKVLEIERYKILKK